MVSDSGFGLACPPNRPMGSKGVGTDPGRGQKAKMQPHRYHGGNLVLSASSLALNACVHVHVHVHVHIRLHVHVHVCISVSIPHERPCPRTSLLRMPRAKRSSKIRGLEG